jgi:hypothetical protein
MLIGPLTNYSLRILFTENMRQKYVVSEHTLWFMVITGQKPPVSQVFGGM